MQKIRFKIEGKDAKWTGQKKLVLNTGKLQTLDPKPYRGTSLIRKPPPP